VGGHARCLNFDYAIALNFERRFFVSKRIAFQNMERVTDVARREAEELTLAARNERETLAREKEGLKKAARAHRSRADKAEDALKVHEEKLADRERKLEEARSQADAWRDRWGRVFVSNAKTVRVCVSRQCQARGQVLRFFSGEYILRGKDFCFYHML